MRAFCVTKIHGLPSVLYRCKWSKLKKIHLERVLQMIITKISLFFATITEFDVLKALFSTLLGLTFTSMYSVYNALCPVWNTGCVITVPIFWGQARFQLFGVIGILLGWIAFCLYLCFGLKTTIWFVIGCFLFVMITFAFQMLAGICKRIFNNKDNKYSL